MVRGSGLARGFFVAGLLWSALTGAAARGAQLDAAWLGGAGNWSVAGNWSGGTVPNNGVDTFNVLIDDLDPDPSVVTMNTNPTIDNLTIDADDELSFANGMDLTVVGGVGAGSIANLGIIRLNSTGTFTDLIPLTGTVTLFGGGQIVLSNSANNRIIGSGGGSLINMDNTIRGSGSLGVGVTPFTNQGLVSADQATSLILDPAAGGMTNQGTMQAEAGATLRLQGGDIANLGGLIQALDGSFVDLDGIVIQGGTLSTEGSGIMRVVGLSTLDGNGSTLTNAGTIQLGNGLDLALEGSIENEGNVAANSTGGFTDLIPTGGAVTLSGGGTITLTNQTNNRIVGASGGSLTNVDNTIQGAGQIGINATGLDNQGTIIAAGTNKLTIDPAAAGMFNSGILRAAAGTLRLQAGSIDNLGGTIEALDASLVEMTDMVVEAGTLSTTGTGVVRALDLNTLDGSGDTLVNAGTFELFNNADVTLLGTIQNSGTIRIASTGTFTDLEPTTSAVVLTGGGIVQLTNQANNRILGVGGGSLVNVDNTIQGAGQLGVNVTPLTNQGTIVADQTVALTIDPDATVGFDNQGGLQVTGSGGMTIAAGPFTTSGAVSVASSRSLSRTGSFVQTAGTTTVDGTLTATGGVDVQGGTLAGGGTVVGAVVNGGVVAPGASPGLLTVTGNYTQSASGALSIEIGGLAVGTEYDRLAVSGSVTLGGTLSVELVDGFVPDPGDMFMVMTYPSQTVGGSFATLNVPCGQVTVTLTAVIVQIAGSAEADMDCNCMLDLDDVPAFALALVDPVAYDLAYDCDPNNADLNGDTIIDGLDVQMFAALLVP